MLDLMKAFGALGYARSYPVAHPTLPSDVAYEYVSCSPHPNMWDLDTEYGRNRMGLLIELIEYYEKACAVEEKA